MVAAPGSWRSLRRLRSRPDVTALAPNDRERAWANLAPGVVGAEWLVTDGLSGYACGTTSELPTRRYHSWLTVAVGDGRRRRLLAGVEERLDDGGDETILTPACWRAMSGPSFPSATRRFAAGPSPTWEVRLDASRAYTRSIVMERGRAGVFVRWTNVGSRPIRLVVRLLLACEDADALLRERPAALPRAVPGGHELRIDAQAPGVFVALRGGASFRVDPCWYRDFRLLVDERRGYDGVADRHSPGALVVEIAPGAEAFASFTPDRCDADPAQSFARASAAASERAAWASRGKPRLAALLRRGIDDFFYRDAHGRTGILAGFPWFSEWGRDAFVSLPGMSLSVDRPERCVEVLRGALPFLRDGLLPNVYGDSPATSHYGSADAALWFSLCVQRAHDCCKEPSKIRAEFEPALVAIVDACRRGAPLGLKVDSEGLLCAGSVDRNATWMDAQTANGPVTPRAGQPVEIVAMWCALLQLLGEWQGGARAREAKQAGEAFVRRFWDPQTGALLDCRDGEVRDASIRPNMVIAAALRRSPLTREQRASVVAIAQRELVTPRGLRTLSPGSPSYRGRYDGGCEGRDLAYHQGTVWPWLAGFHVEAALRAAEPSRLVATAREMAQWLDGFVDEAGRDGTGHVSEVFDGDAPHRPEGTFAQAWNTGELLRALRMCANAIEGRGIGGGA